MTDATVDPALGGWVTWLWAALAVVLPLLVCAALITRSPIRHIAAMPPPVGDVEINPDHLDEFVPLFSGLPVRARLNPENQTLQLLPGGIVSLPSPFLTLLDPTTGEETPLGHVTFARAEDVPLPKQPPELLGGEILLRTPFAREPIARASLAAVFDMAGTTP